jgi:putative ABC transport system ATP-binding protein
MSHLRSMVLERAAVACRGVIKELGSGETRMRVLHDIDLDVFAGAMTFIVGPSGSGKTTLLSTITGILAAEAGSVELFGTRLSELRQSELTRFRGKNVGILLQQFHLFPALTAIENVTVPMLALGQSATSANACAIDLLKELGLSTHLAKYPSQLSVGERQRVALARALIHEPRLLICDEPTAALDAAAGHTVMKLLHRVAVSPDRAVLVVTHDNRIVPFADRIIHMNDGRITRIEANTKREAA